LSYSRQYRLVSKQDFQSVFATNPHKIKHQNVIALYRSNGLLHARLGVVISKAAIRRAVSRNWHRRVIRESFRQHKETLKGLDIVVLLRSECTTQSRKTWRENIDNIWQTIASKPLSSR
jgi:ribonuclease P protein component